jgi:hypothetical protein
MKRPSFQFYPGDWQSDLKLRRCSAAARGVWIDVLCALHDSDDGYGLLRWPLREIASTIGASLPHVRELVNKGVLRGSDTELTEPLVYVSSSGRKKGPPVTLLAAPQPGPIWFSARQVKDEYVRTIRGESSRFGADEGAAPKPAGKQAPKPPFGDGSSTSSPSSASHKTSPAPPPTDVEGGENTDDPDDPDPNGHDPTAYGSLTSEIRALGVSRANPGNQEFRALVDAGATIDEFKAYVDKALLADDPFAYLIRTVGNERKRAAKSAQQLHNGRMPGPAKSPEPAWRSEQRTRNRAFAGPAAAPATGSAVDMEDDNAAPRRLG